MMIHRRLLLPILGLLALLLAGLALPGTGARAQQPEHHVYIATWRGCEEVCQAFMDYLEHQGVAARYTVRSAHRDRATIPDMVKEARRLQPDLVVTWGTTVTLGMVGSHDDVDPERHLIDLPVVYLYVGDPVGSGIVPSGERSGRPNVAGANIAVPMENQIRAMRSYRTVDRIGLVYATNEPNSVVNASQIRARAEAAGIEVVETLLPLRDRGKPDPADIEPVIARMAQKRPDFLVWVSSSFLILNLDSFTDAAVRYGLPIFAAWELPVREGKALLALTSSLRNIGHVAAFQAERILVDGATPGDLPTQSLKRFTLIVNVPVAKRLDLYPPLSILQYADLMTE